ncbi:hypothetical protein JCM8097_001826 [Rhodosporidiobolus ruineniae]
MSADDDAREALQRPRPSEEELLRQWAGYFTDPLLSLAGLRKQAEEGTLEDRGLRSLSWRYFLGTLPSPSPLPSTPTGPSSAFSTYSLLLSHSRSQYTQLRERYLRSPDGNWIQDGPSTGETGEGGGKGGEAGLRSSNGSSKGGKAPMAKVDVKHNNPLGLEEENPWASWFADVELRKVIRQDVARTFPEIDYFRFATTQDRLTNLLFIYCKLNPEIGYRQGMHELLAPFLWLVDYDSIPPSADDPDSLPRLVLARDWVEHDTWALFSALMKSAHVFYDHQLSVSVSPKPASSFPPPATSSASNGSSTLVQPIVSIANHLHSLLATLDPSLHSAFAQLQVEPQLYAIRWLRLLFSREFPLSDTLLLWDGLFARDPSLQLTTHIALAMLLRIRDALIAAAAEGYGEFLHVLLRYPSCPDGSFRTTLLLRQAVYLRDNLSVSGADAVKRQNHELGAAVGEARPADEDVDLRSPGARGMAHRRTASAAPAAGLGLFGKGLVGDLGKAVYGRAEALGINKAISGAYNDFKRDFAEVQAQLEEQRRQRGNFSQIPSALPWEAPPPAPPPATKDALSDLTKMRASSIAMSSAIDLCVAVLERELVPPTPVGSPNPGEGGDDDAGTARKGDIPLSRSRASATASNSDGAGLGSSAGKKAAPPLGPQTMALTALKHVRDVLGGQAVVFDPSVLEPLKFVLEGSSPLPAPQPPLPPNAIVSSPPLPPLPPVESPQPPSTSAFPPSPASPPSKAVRPESSNPTPPSASSSSATAASLSAPTPTLLLGSRAEKPVTSLSRTPQPGRPPPSSASPRPPPTSAYPPLTSSPAPTPRPARPPQPASTLAPPPQPSPAPHNPSFPSASFSTRPPPAVAPPTSSKKPSSVKDPLGAL